MSNAELSDSMLRQLEGLSFQRPVGLATLDVVGKSTAFEIDKERVMLTKPERDLLVDALKRGLVATGTYS